MLASLKAPLWLGLGLTGGLLLGWFAGAQSQEAPRSMLYELRIYTTAPGRLPKLHQRFRRHTMKLFEKHGMVNVGYWVPLDKKDTLIYIVAHRDQEAAKRSWDAFRNDPQWQKVFRESRKDGPIVTKVQRHFMRPTDYSPMQRTP